MSVGLIIVDEGLGGGGKGIAKATTANAPVGEVCGSGASDFDMKGQEILTAPDGVSFITFVVDIVNDGFYEYPDEHFTLQLVDLDPGTGVSVNSSRFFF